MAKVGSFNTQPPEGGWDTGRGSCRRYMVSTRSRPKAAGWMCGRSVQEHVFQHAAARRRLVKEQKMSIITDYVSTRSRPKAAGTSRSYNPDTFDVSTRSRPKAAGTIAAAPCTASEFQHAAARRRLAVPPSTRHPSIVSFNTQPPEGGWREEARASPLRCRFQHAAARRRLVPFSLSTNKPSMFQHAAARRRLEMLLIHLC